jgi:hypothetical protein
MLEASCYNQAPYWIEKGFLLNDIKPLNRASIY